MNRSDREILTIMFAELEKTPAVYRPSEFWSILNKTHVDYLSKVGIKNFKRSINTRYFSWGILGIIRHQLSPLIQEVAKGNFLPIFGSRFNNYNLKSGDGTVGFNPITAIIYRVYVASLMEYVLRIDTLSLFEKLEESTVGNPFSIKYKDKLISQDLCNSIHEFYSIKQKNSFPKNVRVADLGAGYGRVGYVFLKAIPDSSYCVIDIPPALFVSQSYLKAIFPKEKIFSFRQFTSFKEIKNEFESCRIKFLMPHQLELLPNKYFDLFINISSFHEMTRNQIKNYIELINRLCRGYFYTKQWRVSRTQDNGNISEKEYPIPKKWKVIAINSPHPIQKLFFDTLYKIA